MEDYVIIDSVLQAIHMSKHKPKPKHIKKYQLSSPFSSSSVYNNKIHNYTICYDQTSPSKLTHQSLKAKLRISTSIRNKNTSNLYINGGVGKKDSKIQMKYILQQNQKIVNNINLQDNHGGNYYCFLQFFNKKQIQPRSSRQYPNRTHNLVKTPQLNKGIFYDSNIQLIRKKSPNCIILPQRKHKDEGQHTKIRTPRTNIKNLIKQQWQKQKLQRRAQCKTSSMNNTRTLSRYKIRKIQQQCLNKQNLEQYVKSTLTQRYNYNNCQNSNLDFNMNKKILPLSKNQINNKASSIMNKYGVVASKCYIKFFNS